MHDDGGREEIVMSFTGVDSLDRSIAKANAWMADIDKELGADNRQLAYRVARAWLHCLRDRLTVHFAAQLPELLRGVFYDGWNTGHVPVKYGASEYVTRFARDARVHDTDVTKAAQVVTAVARRHMSAGVVDEAPLLPADLRRLLEATPPAGEATTAADQ
jgi:uncharacterized protein (DUF2267 family)